MLEYDCNENRHIPEFLAIFTNQGDFKVKVRLINCDISGAFIAVQTMAAHELEKLIDPETGMFFTRMFFDDHLCGIEKYDVNLVRKMIMITASPLE